RHGAQRARPSFPTRRSSDLAEAVAAQAQRLGAQSVVADISNEAAAEAAVQATVAAFGSVNGLVNCAGIVRGEKILGKNGPHALRDRKSTRLNSSHVKISYAV